MATNAMGNPSTPAAAHAAEQLPGWLPKVHSDVAITEPTYRLMVIEDDRPLANLLGAWYQSRGFSVELAHDGEQAAALLDRLPFDLLLLDLNLPKMDGLSLLAHLRASANPHVPVIVVSGRSRTEDTVSTLNLGADDYLMKPFSLHELLARSQAVLRRRSPMPVAAPKPAALTINRDEYAAHRDGKRIELTPREFAILEYMMERRGKPVSRAALMQDVWNTPFDPGTNIVDVYMKYLRDKIDAQAEEKLIRTIRGVGYILRCA